MHYEPIIASLDRAKGANSWLTLDLTEGKNREVKRVLEHYGLVVSRLIRISFGPFQLGDLAEGAAEEIKSRTLQDQLGTRLAEEAEVDFEAPRFEHATNEEAQQLRPRKKYDARKPSEKRAQIARGEVQGFEVKQDRFATRKGKIVEVERISIKPPSAESLGTGQVLWRRGMTVDSPMGPSRVSVNREDGSPYQGARPQRARSSERDEHPAKSRFGEPGPDRKSYGEAKPGGKGAGNKFAGKGSEGKDVAGKRSQGKPWGSKSPGEKSSTSNRPSAGRPAGGRPPHGRPSGGRSRPS